MSNSKQFVSRTSADTIESSSTDIDLLLHDKDTLITFLTTISKPIVGKEGSEKVVSFMMQSLRDEKDVYRGCVTLRSTSNNNDDDDAIPICHGYGDCPSLPTLELNKEEADDVTSMAVEDDQSSSTNAEKENTKPPRRSCVNANTKSNNNKNNTKSTTKKKSKNSKQIDYTKVKYPCVCDGNPFCLASLGGVVTCVLYEHSNGKNQTIGLRKENRSYHNPDIIDFSIVNKNEVSAKNANDGNKKKDADVIIVNVDDNSDEDMSVVANVTQKQNGQDKSIKMVIEEKVTEMEVEDKEKIAEMEVEDKRKITEMEIEDKRNVTSDEDSLDDYLYYTPLKNDKQSSKETSPKDTLISVNKETATKSKPTNNKVIESSNEEINWVSDFNISLVNITIPDNSLKLVSQLRHNQIVHNSKILQYLKPLLPTSINPIDALETIQSFHNSFFLRRETSSKKIYLSKPPGIENLGATCYLNAFLQCLAHNPAFIQSIASWKQISMKTPMLEKLQQLLLGIRYGPNHSLSAQEFASTLNLDSDLMQDPNEFARLLLDRMQELFSQSDNLRDVLPSLFQGVIEYSTICKDCENTSLRQEHFMEFMVPLQCKTLEQCIKVYGREEELKGDNQYFCSYCDSKKDATRSWKFKKLPPVMNIQVARYAYNYQYGTKQKVMRELSLEATLHLNKKEYHLVGVLNHVGASAISGHYIAHAKDWITGLWFECNDELVTYLPTGSPAAYVDKPKKGSTDAYHMFYVEKNYLSTQVQDQISNKYHISNPVLQPIIDQRKETFMSIQSLQALHQKNINQLNDQKNMLLSQVFPGLTTDVSIFLPKTSDDAVWVDSNWLRDVVSCNNPYVWENRDMTKNILCRHGAGLDPRRARQGKLITKSMYKAITSTIPVPPGTLEITPEENLRCEMCEALYENHLFTKNRKFMTLLQLYYELETSANTSNQDQELPYAISRKFATDVKKYTHQKLKQIVSSVEIQMNGIDSLNLKEIFDNDIVYDNASTKNEDQNSTDSFDPTVNINILCVHGNMTNEYARQRIRFVSFTTWEKIKMLFPKAIEVSNKACPQCQKDVNIGQDISEGLKQWSETILDNGDLEALFEKKELTYSASPGNVLMLVPSKVLEAWRFCVADPLKKKKNPNSMNWREFLPNVLQSFFRLERPEEELGILCCAHSKTQPFPPYVDWYLEQSNHCNDVRDSLGLVSNEKKKCPSRKSSPVEILPLENYKAFVTSLEMLRDIFAAPYVDESRGSALFPRGSFSMEETLLPNIVKITFGENQQYKVEPPICNDNSCFQKELYEQRSDEEGVIDLDNEDSTESNKIKSETEEEIKKSCTIKVDEVHENTNLESLAETYSNIESSISKTQDDASTSRRRSSRKRKSRDFFSCDSIRRFDISFDLEHDKLAKIRLLLYETHGISPLNQELCLCLKSTITTDANDASPILVVLRDMFNNSTLPEIVCNHSKEPGISSIILPISSSSIYCIFLRYNKDEEYFDDFLTIDDKKPRKKKPSKQQREALESSLIDSLMNCIGIDPSSSSIGKRKGNNSATETGFVGTLLQSSIQQQSSSNVVEVL